MLDRTNQILYSVQFSVFEDTISAEWDWFRNVSIATRRAISDDSNLSEYHSNNNHSAFLSMVDVLRRESLNSARRVEKSLQLLFVHLSVDRIN